MSKYIIPTFLLLIFLVALIKRVPLYDTFTAGVKESLRLVYNILPYIGAIFIAMELLNVSGLSNIISGWLAPVLKTFGIPPELSKLIILKPLSGSGSLAMLEEIFLTEGVDSYIARCASVIVGCSETIFYISAVYFSTSSIKKLRYAIPVAVFSMIIGAIVSCAICRIM